MSELTREQVIDYLSGIPVVELSSLIKDLEGKWGVKATPAAPMGGAFLTPVTPLPVEEAQTEFDVIVLAVAGDKKIAAIKIVRETIGLGLKEAKDLIDALPGKPAMIKQSCSKVEAEDLRTKLEGAGCTVKLQ